MTDVPIRVRVTSDEAVKGKAVVVRSLDDIRRAAANTNNELGQMGPRIRKSATEGITAVDLLKRAFVVLGGVLVFRKIIDLSNAFSDLRNKVLVTTNSMESANQVLDELFKIANKNRAPVEALAGLYQKVSIASRELGASQKQLFQFTDVVAKGLAIQGGSAESASGAILQLSQAMGSGIVRAEEFNSILEGAFPIAQAAARGLDKAGGSVAKLRSLIVDGQVTSKEFFNALLSQSDELEATFAKIQPTLRSAGIVFRNSIIAQFEKSSGVFAMVAKALIFLAENLDTLVRIATVVGIALLTAFAPGLLVAAISRVTLAVNILTAAIAANPIGALVVIVTAAISALVIFSDKISLSSDRLANLQDLLSVFWEDAKEIFSAVADFFSGIFEPVSKKLEGLVGEFEFSIEGMIRLWAKFADKIVGIYVGVYNVIVTYFKQLPRVIEDIFNQAMNNAIDNVERAINTISRGLNNLPGIDIKQTKFDRVKNPAAESAKNFGGDIKNAFLEGYNSTKVSDYVDKAFERAEEKAKARIKNVKDETVDLGQIVTGEDVATGKIDKAKDAMQDFGSYSYELFNEFDYTFQGILGRLEDSLVQVARTGKFSFKDLVSSVLDDLTRLAVQQTVTKPLSQAFSGVASNFLGSFFGGGEQARPSPSFVGPQPATPGIFSTIGSGLKSLFTFDQGVDFVPRDMLAMVHKGEKITPAGKNNSDGQMITVNLVMPNVQDYNSFRQNQAQASAQVARSLQTSLRRNA